MSDLYDLYEYLWDAANATGDDRYARGKTKVWYMRPMSIRDFSMGPKFLKQQGIPLPTLDTIDDTHVLLGEVDERNLERVWEMMQGEAWSPHGEAKHLIRRLGLAHTSMSVGDIVQIDSQLFMVDRRGFDRIAGAAFRARFVCIGSQRPSPLLVVARRYAQTVKTAYGDKYDVTLRGPHGGEIKTPRMGTIYDVEVHGSIFEVGDYENPQSDFDIDKVDWVTEDEEVHEARYKDFLRQTGLRDADVREMVADEFQARSEAHWEWLQDERPSYRR